MGLDTGNSIGERLLLVGVSTDRVANRHELLAAAAPVDCGNETVEPAGEQHRGVNFKGLGFCVRCRGSAPSYKRDAPKISCQKAKKLFDLFPARGPQVRIGHSNAQVEGSSPAVWAC